MPRTTIAATVVQGPYVALPAAANSLDVTATAADVANKNQTPLTGKETVIARNTGAGARTVTFTSVADARLKRSGDVGPYTMQAGEMMAFDFSDLEGWRQPDGNLYFEGEHAEVLFTVLRRQ
jgi:hypothetical protein